MSDENNFYIGACLLSGLFFLFSCFCTSYGFISIGSINFFFPFSSFDYKYLTFRFFPVINKTFVAVVSDSYSRYYLWLFLNFLFYKHTGKNICFFCN